MYYLKHSKEALVNFSYMFISPINRRKETPLWNYLRKKQNASITIEAAVVCTFAILFLGTFLCFFVLLQEEFQLKQQMYFIQQKKMLWGINAESSEEYVDYVSVSLLGTGRTLLLENRLQNYGFNGYDDEIVKGNTYVYLTEYGTVYHKKLSCPHLDITVMAVSVNEVEEKRNESGGKYYPCEYCGKRLLSGICYITEYGNRYHGKKDCGSLMRNIRKIPLNEIENLEACSDCWN